MQSLTSVRLRDYIIKTIRDQILSGAFPGGMRLAQEELAASLGVSRIPVREALQIMEEQGFVVRLPSRHMMVTEVSEEQLHQSFQMISEIQFRYGRFILESAEKEPLLAALEAWDREDEVAFHQLFVRYLDNAYLCRVLKNMLDSYVDFACGLPAEGSPVEGSSSAGSPSAGSSSAGSPSVGSSSVGSSSAGSPSERKSCRVKLLSRTAEAFRAERWQEAEDLLREYYRLLEQEVKEERKRH